MCSFSANEVQLSKHRLISSSLSLYSLTHSLTQPTIIIIMSVHLKSMSTIAAHRREEIELETMLKRIIEPMQLMD
jgi:hypothetical protein